MTCPPGPANSPRLLRLTARSFEPTFWNKDRNCLFDVVTPSLSGTLPPQVRPNQLFAVSQPFSPLSKDKQLAVTA